MKLTLVAVGHGAHRSGLLGLAGLGSGRSCSCSCSFPLVLGLEELGRNLTNIGGSFRIIILGVLGRLCPCSCLRQAISTVLIILGNGGIPGDSRLWGVEALGLALCLQGKRTNGVEIVLHCDSPLSIVTHQVSSPFHDIRHFRPRLGLWSTTTLNI